MKLVPCCFCRYSDDKVNLFKDLFQAGVAEQNYLYKLIKFWQSTKDQKQGIHIANVSTRFYIPFYLGINENENDKLTNTEMPT